MEKLFRDYNMSDSELMMLASNFVGYMTRDEAQFITRGVSVADRTAFLALGNAFEVFPSDAEYQGLISIAVQSKNDIRATLMANVQLVSGFVEQQWGVGSGQYKRLSIKGIATAKDAEFLFKCRVVHRVATEYLSTLSAIGLTEAMLDTLEDNAQLYENGLNAVEDATAERDEKTNERTIKGNELYEYVQKYSRVGKLIWENVNSAKYNDYIIYKTVHSGLSKPQNLESNYNPINPAIISLSWDIVIGAVEYEIFVCIVDTGNPSTTFSLLNTTSLLTFDAPSTPGKRNYFKIRAKNPLHTSSFSDETFQDVPFA